MLIDDYVYFRICIDYEWLVVHSVRHMRPYASVLLLFVGSCYFLSDFFVLPHSISVHCRVNTLSSHFLVLLLSLFALLMIEVSLIGFNFDMMRLCAIERERNHKFWLHSHAKFDLDY